MALKTDVSMCSVFGSGDDSPLRHQKSFRPEFAERQRAPHLAGHWRWIYVVSSTAALYLNCFVAVVQTFQKVPFVAAFAPTQSEPPFAIAQLIVLAILIALGVLAVRNFHPMVQRSTLNPNFKSSEQSS